MSDDYDSGSASSTLFSVIDWMMAIPPPLQDALLDNIKELERSAAMPYMNPFEKRGLERGGRAAARAILTLQLKKRFGNLSRESVDTLERGNRATNALEHCGTGRANHRGCVLVALNNACLPNPASSPFDQAHDGVPPPSHASTPRSSRCNQFRM